MKSIIITGQTATGKTSFALDLAKKINGELINCDSRQVYKHLNIITGKDIGSHRFHKSSNLNAFDIGYYNSSCNNETMQQYNNAIPIWLYDIIDPKQYFSSYDYVQCAKYIVDNIFQRGKTPIFVGGTYLYIKHLLYGVDTERIPPDQKLRNELVSKTIHELQTILQHESREIFEALNEGDRNNPQRLIRKIEIAQSRRDVINHVATNTKIPLPIQETEIIGLKFRHKEMLINAIKSRVEERIKNGALEEVENLLKQGYNEQDPGLRTIGYTQIIQYLKKQISWETTISQWITKEVQYAKRQMTFMKKDRHIRWIEIG